MAISKRDAKFIEECAMHLNKMCASLHGDSFVASEELWDTILKYVYYVPEQS